MLRIALFLPHQLLDTSLDLFRLAPAISPPVNPRCHTGKGEITTKG